MWKTMKTMQGSLMRRKYGDIQGTQQGTVVWAHDKIVKAKLISIPQRRRWING